MEEPTDKDYAGDQQGRDNGYTLDQLAEELEELRRVARAALRKWPGHSWQTTDLVDQALCRLMGKDWRAKMWENKSQFFLAFGAAVKRELSEHWRRRSAKKRGGRRRRHALNDAVAICRDQPDFFIDIVDELEAIGRSPKFKNPALLAAVGALWILAGFNQEEIAQELNLSRGAVWRHIMDIREEFIQYYDGSR